MTTRVTGIIIGKKDFREADRMFVIYTKEHGKITALAQGCRKLSSKLSGNLELLHHATFTIAHGKQINRIATVDPIETHEAIKRNLDALTIALYCCDLCDRSVQEGVADSALYEHLKDFLSVCSQIQGAYVRTTQLFILKLATLLGYRPPAKGYERIVSLLSQKGLSSAADEKFPPGIESVVEGCLSSLIERPIPAQIFFDFLSKKPALS
ncbi:MAG: DNA repair protein RecO [Patescibacteria group bacterium]